jgi:hypothetical protein
MAFSGLFSIMKSSSTKWDQEREERQLACGGKRGNGVKKFNGDFGASFVREFAQRRVAGRNGSFFRSKFCVFFFFLREVGKARSKGLHRNP